MSEEAPEGSLDRKAARWTLIESAEFHRNAGLTYMEWVDSLDYKLLDAVSDQDLRAIRGLIWRAKE